MPIGTIYAEQMRREAARRLELKQTARETFRPAHLRLAADYRERRFRADRFEVPTPVRVRRAFDTLILGVGLLGLGFVLLAYALDLLTFWFGR